MKRGGGASLNICCWGYASASRERKCAEGFASQQVNVALDMKVGDFFKCTQQAVRNNDEYAGSSFGIIWGLRLKAPWRSRRR